MTTHVDWVERFAADWHSHSPGVACTRFALVTFMAGMGVRITDAQASGWLQEHRSANRSVRAQRPQWSVTAEGYGRATSWLIERNCVRHLRYVLADRFSSLIGDIAIEVEPLADLAEMAVVQFARTGVENLAAQLDTFVDAQLASTP